MFHQRDPPKPKPPRKRWYKYQKCQLPLGIARAYADATLGIGDRIGRATLQHIRNTKQPTIEAATVPELAADAMVLFDGAPLYKALAKEGGTAMKCSKRAGEVGECRKPMT